jgi:hypothetical protein
MSKSRARRAIDRLEAKGWFSRLPDDVVANLKRSGHRAHRVVAELGDMRHVDQALCILELATL